MLMMTNMKQMFINILLTLQVMKEEKLKHISAADQNSKSLFPQVAKLSVRIAKDFLQVISIVRSMSVKDSKSQRLKESKGQRVIKE